MISAGRPGAVFDGNSGEPACDSYRRWAEDVALLAGAGLDAYRFSLSWPRILPAGTGTVNPAGIEYYRTLMESLRTVGVEPWPTLYHWDLPAALQAKGGWENRDIVAWFGEYAAVVAEYLGDLFGRCWILNEPNYHALLGYRRGTNAPGMKSEKAFYSAMHHQNVVQRDHRRLTAGSCS
jgi:beta-glucosidase